MLIGYLRSHTLQISGSLEGEGSPTEADRPKSGSDDDPSAGNKLGSSSDGSSFSDIEKKLKEATFSRHEYDRLTKLLHSRSSHVDERSMETSNTAIKKERLLMLCSPRKPA